MSDLRIHQADAAAADDGPGPADDPAELGRLWPLMAAPVRNAVLTLARAAAGVPPAAEELPDLLDMAAVTRLLGVSRATVDRMDAEGRLPAPVRVGRFKKWGRADFLAWLAARRPDGSTFTRCEWARLTAKK